MIDRYQQEFQSLNSAQKQAVEQIEGPVLVLAGPGTGKTKVLTLRIAMILQKIDINPDSILALTFTEAASSNMRNRLIELIGETAYRVRIQTFHSFCDGVIQSSPEYFTLERGSQAATDLERYAIIEKILQENELEFLRTPASPFHFVPDIMRQISVLKKEGLDPEKFAQVVESAQESLTAKLTDLKPAAALLQQKVSGKQSELAQVYAIYQQELGRKKRYDYDDMILMTIQAFENYPDLLSEYQEQLQYFLVDEFQDTNSSQFRVLNLLSSYWGQDANVFVVGDPHQTIYRFQGADTANISFFRRSYPLAEVINLNQGYRCTQEVYESSFRLISSHKTSTDFSGKDSLTSSKGSSGQPVSILEFVDSAHEAEWVALSIKELIDHGTPSSQIVVLARQHKDLIIYRDILASLQVAYTHRQPKNILNSPIIEQVLLLFNCILNLRSASEAGELFSSLSQSWFKLDRLQLLKLSRYASTHRPKIALFDLLQKNLDELQKEHSELELDSEKTKQIQQCCASLVAWGQEDLETPFSSWCQSTWQKSGLIEYLSAQPNRVELFLELNCFFAEVRSSQLDNPQLHLEDFLKRIRTRLSHNLPINLTVPSSGSEKVTLSTVHAAKGLEWPHVFVVGCRDGAWGGRRDRERLPLPEGVISKLITSSTETEGPEQMARAQPSLELDDRRVLYVAMTRAIKTLIITYPKVTLSEQGSKEEVRSIFLTQLMGEESTSLVEAHSQLHDLSQPKLIGKTVSQVARNLPFITHATANLSEAQHQEFLEKLLVPIEDNDWSEQERGWVSESLKDFSLSASSLNEYLRSPREFFFKQILGVPQPISPTLIFGTAVHKALEHVFSHYIKQKSLPTFESAAAVLKSALEREPLSDPDFKKRLKQGKYVLNTYLNSQELLAALPDVFACEKFFGFSSPLMMGRVRLKGKVDRIDWIDRGSKAMRIIDYKTGRAKTMGEIEGSTLASQAEFSQAEKNLPSQIRSPYKRQLLFYSLLSALDRTFPGEVRECVLEYVEPTAGKNTVRTVQIENSDLNLLKELIHQVFQEITELKFLS